MITVGMPLITCVFDHNVVNLKNNINSNRLLKNIKIVHFSIEENAFILYNEAKSSLISAVAISCELEY